MNKTTLIPTFGIYGPEDAIALSTVLSKVWKLTQTPMGAMASPEIFENLPFRTEDITIPFLVLNANELKMLVPDYNKIRASRPETRVIVCIKNEEQISEVTTRENMPDFFINTTTWQLIIPQ